MNRVKKSLVTLAAIGLVGGLSFKAFGDVYSQIPERFKNYKSGQLMGKQIVKEKGVLLEFTLYDIDGDNIPDVMESRPVLKFGENNFKKSEFPLAYWFDLNGDKKYSPTEVVRDEEMDGWNGNEKWFNRTYI